MSGAGLASENSYAFRLGLCGIGWAIVSRGEGLGETNGDCMLDFWREKLGREAGKPADRAGLEESGGGDGTIQDASRENGVKRTWSARNGVSTTVSVCLRMASMWAFVQVELAMRKLA